MGFVYDFEIPTLVRFGIRKRFWPSQGLGRSTAPRAIDIMPFVPFRS